MGKRRSKKKSPRKKKSLQTKPISENTLDSSRTIDLRSHFLTLLVCLVLVLATSAVYWHVTGNDFILLDDNVYVYENPHIQNGLTSDSIIWAFTTTHAGLKIPLTWLSLMLDYELYGLDAGGYHLTNLLLHLANVLLLFLVFKLMTGGLWRSGFVAALFALHPLHVESVAWVAERKHSFLDAHVVGLLSLCTTSNRKKIPADPCPFCSRPLSQAHVGDPSFCSLVVRLLASGPFSGRPIYKCS